MRGLKLLVTTLALGAGCKTAKEPAPDASAPPPAPAPTVASADGRDYGDKWLVILSSSKTPGVVPDGITKFDGAPVRLRSTELKGLMPCYEIVVAKAFDQREAAVAHSKALTAKGVDNYPKHAGKYVGEQPRVEAYCRGEAKPATAACADGVRFVESVGERAYVHLGVDAVVRDRLIVKAPAPKSIDGRNWSAKLGVKSIEGYTVGATLAVIDEAGARATCKIESFVALTRGEPHFSWFEAPNPRKPGCGEAEIYGRLSCSGRRGLAVPVKGPRIEVLSSEVAADATARAARGLMPVPGEARDPATERAKAQGEALKETAEVRVHRAGERRVLTLDVRLTTREGNDVCGADDVNVHLLGAMDVGTGKVRLPLSEVGTKKLLGVVERGGEVALLTESWPYERSLEFLGDTGAACSVAVAYCDCGC